MVATQGDRAPERTANMAKVCPSSQLATLIPAIPRTQSSEPCFSAPGLDVRSHDGRSGRMGVESAADKDSTIAFVFSDVFAI